LVLNSPKRSTPVRMAKSTNWRRKSWLAGRGGVHGVRTVRMAGYFLPIRPGKTSFSVRIVTLNVNGIRSAASKGFLDWMKRQKADVVCLQEIKAQESDLPKELLAPAKLHAFFHPAEKKGYSGVAMYARKEPDRAVLGLGIKDIDAQGRYLQLDYGNLSVVSLYLPSGSSGEEAQARKFSFMKRFMPKLKAMKASGREIILCGDWNIAHKEIDLKNWRSNQKNSGSCPRSEPGSPRPSTRGAGWTFSGR